MDDLKLRVTDLSKHISEAPAIAEKYSEAEKTKMAKASKEFETLLTSMMLKSMNQSSKGMFGDEDEEKSSFGNDMMGMLYENELAGLMTRSRGLGIAEMIYQKMTGEKLDIKLPIKQMVDRLNIDFKDIDNIKKVSPSTSSINRLNNYDEIISQASEKFGVPENVIKSVILTESAANPNALSSCKAKGLMQLMDGTAKDMGVKNVWDAKENIFGGTKYLSMMLRQYNGDLKLALAAYNAGPANVNKYDGVPPFTETQNYVTRVFGYLKNWEGDNAS